MKSILLAGLFFASSWQLGFSQSNINLFQDIDITTKSNLGEQVIKTKHQRFVEIQQSTMTDYLANAPMELTPASEAITYELSLLMPDGTIASFDMEESPMLEPALASQFPSIKTYTGKGITHRTDYLKLSITDKGVHVMILSEKGTIYMDPYNFNHPEILVVYNKRDFNPQGKSMHCGVGDNAANPTVQNVQKSSITTPTIQFGDCTRRNYRLALAATAEYTTFHGGTVNLALAAMVVTMNRVNGVYEKDLGVHMNLVANTNLLIYTNATTDPYTNTSATALLTQNQSNCDAVIGNANYDLGHVFSTGGGGLSGLGVVCNSTQKARSETGSSAPVGDAYDIDYVAHEMGHQFSGNHTFNATTGSCGGGNINNGTAVETGSGITIMAYAGICSPNDIAPHSIDNFHSTNLAEMSTFITGTATCATTQTITNNSPVITNSTGNKTIPKSTPFMLSSVATDVDGDALSYVWEQYDNQVISNVPSATNTGGPMFRCFSPNSEPTWYFPRLDSLITNQTLKWQVLPSVARTMNFRLTVRDNHSGNGCTSSATAALTVDATSGPFVVTAPTVSGLSYAAFTNQTVTWNVANTTASPVSCANVDILLSTDGGLTYPINLITATPNDGSQVVQIPNNITNTARIMVKANGNIFFDISNNNFAITAPLVADYTISTTPTTQSVCVNNDASYAISTTSILGYTGSINLTLSGLPNGASYNFNPSTLLPGGNSTLTISGLSSSGNYNLTVNASSQSSNQTSAVTLTVFGNAGSVTLTFPSNNLANVSTTPTLTWQAATNAASYDLQIATNNTFTSGLQTINGILTNSYALTTVLSPNTNYFWRVRALNTCNTGSYSPINNFTTANVVCSNFISTDVPKSIASANANNITSTLTIPNNGTIVDLNVIGVKGTHTYVSDLLFMLKSPGNITDTLVNGICGSNANFSFSFDDASTAAYSSIPCPPTDSNTYQPLRPLSIFNSTNVYGTWTMMVNDLYAQDGGALTNWGLRVCYTPVCNIVPTISVTNANCPNNCTASASVSYTGGVAPVYYSWTNTNQTTATVSNLCNNSYTVTLTDAQGCTATANTSISEPASPSNVTTTSPTNNQTVTSTNVTFSWNASANSSSYQIEIATNTSFTNIVNSSSNITSTSYTASLSANTSYYWRVRGVNNCGNGNFSTTKIFTTPNIICNNYLSTDVPKTISAVNANTITSILNITGLGTITDVNVISLKGTHTYVSDLLFTLKSPSNISDTLLYSVCGSNANFNIGFDDASIGNYASIPCPPTDSNAYQPYSPLSIFNNSAIAGQWTLTVNDLYAQDGGTLTNWGLHVCYTTPCAMNAFSSASPTDCSNNGSATAAAIGGSGSYTYAWSNGQTTSTASNLAAGVYSVVITDSQGCTATTNATIAQTGSIPTQPSAITSVNDTLCAGGNSNSFSVINESGVTYTWTYSGNGASITSTNNTASINFANNATSGTVTVTPSNGCGNGAPRTLAITIGALPNTPAAFIASTNQICTGDSNVIYTVPNVAGVSYGWTYSGVGATITNNGNSASIDFAANATAGTLSVVATNSCGNSNPRNINITLKPNPTTPVISALNTAICAGQSTSLSSNVSNVTWYKNGSFYATGTSTPTISTAGVYTAINTTACGSATSNTVTITVNPLPAAPTVSNGISYCTGMTASQLSATGQSLLWYVNASGGIGSNVAPTPSTATAGVSNFYVSQTIGGCESPRAQISITTNQTPSTPTINVIGSTNICDGSNVILSSSSIGNNTWSNNQTTQSISVSTSGTYFVTVSIGNCSATSAGTLVTVNTTPVIINVNSNNPTSCVAADGIIQLESNAPNTPYAINYSKDGVNQSTIIASSDANAIIHLNNLVGGNYSGFVISANGCSSSVYPSAVLLNFASNLNASLSAQGTTSVCMGDSVILEASSGQYSYQWMLDGNNLNDTGSQLAATVTGMYSVMITDLLGCNAISNPLQVQVNPLPVVSVTAGNILCAGGTAAVVVSANGSQGPYSGTGSFAEVAGTHTYIISDANNCSNTYSLTLTEPTQLIFGFANVSSTTCGNSNGVINVVNTNGGVGPYAYSIDNSAYFANSTFSNLSAGQHQISVKDANACVVTNSNIFINSSNTLSLSGIATNVTCNGGNDGSISLVALGGNGTLTYQLGNLSQTNNVFLGLTASTYTVTVLDSSNCSASTNVTVSEPGAFVLSSITGQASPLEQSTESYYVSNGSSIFYNWLVSGGAILSGQGTDTVVVQWGAAGIGTIIVTGTTTASCQDSSILAISIQSTVGIQSIIGDESVQLLPNPSNGLVVLIIENSNQERLQVRISDMLGQVVFVDQLSSRNIYKTIDLTLVTKGIYLVEVDGKNTKFTRKLIIE